MQSPAFRKLFQRLWSEILSSNERYHARKAKATVGLKRFLQLLFNVHIFEKRSKVASQANCQEEFLKSWTINPFPYLNKDRLLKG